VLELLEKGIDASEVPQDTLERLIGYQLLAYRPPGRIILTGTAKEVLLRRQYGLPLPCVHDAESGDAEDATDEGEMPEENVD
jgi:hypothetical protein